MNVRLMSISDEASVQRTSGAQPGEDKSRDGLYSNIKSRLRNRLPGGFSPGDLIKARLYPSIQAVVLGKVWGREALRVITAPYTSASAPVAANAIDLPASLIPDQTTPPCWCFDNPKIVTNCVKHLADKSTIKREQEVALIDWINKKDNLDCSTYSAISDVQEGDREVGGNSDALVASKEVDLLSEDSSFSADSTEHKVKSRNHTSPARERPEEAPSVPTIVVEDKKEMEEFKKEVSHQLSELRDLVKGIAKKQIECEEQVNKVASQITSSSSSQWEQLEAKVQAMTAPGSASEKRSTSKHERVLDDDLDWPADDTRSEDLDWQVRFAGHKKVGDPQEEKLECPFRVQARRLDGFRVPRAHRRAHRRFLEEVYGSHDSATAAARAILEQMEKETRAPSWEVAGLLNAARGLDVLLLEHQDGMWSQWNQPMVDFMARYFFEMLARIRPEEDVVQLMNPELQRKVREFNFGKQRAYGPLNTPFKGNAQRPWKAWQPYTTNSGMNNSNTRRDGTNASKRGTSSPDGPSEAGVASNEVVGNQGNWVWQPPPPVGRPPPAFRPENTPTFHGLAGPRPTQ